MPVVGPADREGVGCHRSSQPMVRSSGSVCRER